jgi:hypothetical protein
MKKIIPFIPIIGALIVIKNIGNGEYPYGNKVVIVSSATLQGISFGVCLIFSLKFIIHG